MRPLRLPVMFAAVAAATALGAAPAYAAIDAGQISSAVAAFTSNQHVYAGPGTTVDTGQVNDAIANKDVYVGIFKSNDLNSFATAADLKAANKQGIYIAITTNDKGEHLVKYGGNGVKAINIDKTVSDLARTHHNDTTGLAKAVVAEARSAEVAAQSQTQTGTVVPRSHTSSNGSAGTAFFGLLLALGAVFAFFTVRKRKRQRELEAKQFEEVRGPADEDVTALGESVTGLNFDISRATPESRQYYEQALGAYEHAKQAMTVARRPEDMRGVTAALEEGRWALAATTASAAGQAIPERRPPCFFNPQHGPSVSDIDYSPEGGASRQVPVCAADLDRVQRGLNPDVRQVMVGGQNVPYWNAGPMYAPWAGGYYGGYGSMMPGLFGGLLLADLLTPSYGYGGFGGFGGGYGGGGYDQGYAQGYNQGADSGGNGGGGDSSWGSGGGDWGGGGGDFGGGGGDFGGGGDSGGGGDF